MNQQDMTIGGRQRQLLIYRTRYHSTCPMCGIHVSDSLSADIKVCDDGTVEVSTICSKRMEGYANHVHGGIIASLLDCAMTNCLFSYGIAGVTGELTVRILHPIASDITLTARAWLERKLSSLCFLSAELYQNDQLAAKAKGKFMNMSSVANYR